MAQFRITGLPPQSLALSEADLIEIVDVDDLVSPTGASKKITLAQLETFINRSVRRPVRVVVTTAVTISTAIVAGATAGGVTLAAGNRVLLTAQVDLGTNGIYVVQSSGAPLRAADFAVGMAVAGSLIPVTEGTWRGTLWICDSLPGSDVVGTHTLTFKRPNADNPPFSDVLAVLRKEADVTSLLRFDLSAIATATTRVITVPNANVNLGDLVAGPGSALSTALALFSGTTGKLLQGSPVLVDPATGKIAVKTSFCSRNVAADGATITFNMNVSNNHWTVLGGNRQLAVSNVTTDQAFMVRIGQGAGGPFTPLWWAGIRWPGGVLPTFTTVEDHYDWFGFICTGSGTYDGFPLGSDFG